MGGKPGLRELTGPHASARLDAVRGGSLSPGLLPSASPECQHVVSAENFLFGDHRGKTRHGPKQSNSTQLGRTRGSQLSLDEKRADLELEVVKNVAVGGGDGRLRAPPWGAATEVGAAQVPGEGPANPAAPGGGAPPGRVGDRLRWGRAVPPHSATPGAQQSWFRSRPPAARTHAAAARARPRSAAAAAGAARAALRSPSRRGDRASPRLRASRSFTRLRAAATRAWPASHPGVAARAAGIPDKTSWPVRSFSGAAAEKKRGS